MQPWPGGGFASFLRQSAWIRYRLSSTLWFWKVLAVVNIPDLWIKTQKDTKMSFAIRFWSKNFNAGTVELKITHEQLHHHWMKSQLSVKTVSFQLVMNQLFRKHKDRSQRSPTGNWWKEIHLQPFDHWRVLRTTRTHTPRTPHNWTCEMVDELADEPLSSEGMLRNMWDMITVSFFFLSGKNDRVQKYQCYWTWHTFCGG